MSSSGPTYTYAMLPVLIGEIREQRCYRSSVRRFVTQAREELQSQLGKLAKKRSFFQQQLRSRSERITMQGCFEAEQRAILFSLEATNGVERFLETENSFFLGEALADFRTSESYQEKYLRLLKQLPALLQEDRQRAA